MSAFKGGRADKKPMAVLFLYRIFDWEAHLVPAMGESIRRFACTEQQRVKVR
jgi:hypothetical protein